MDKREAQMVKVYASAGGKIEKNICLQMSQQKKEWAEFWVSVATKEGT